MTDVRFFANAGGDTSEPLSVQQREVLERALAKTAMLGARVGVDMDQMIQLLESGMTVRELLEYLVTLADEFA